MASFLVAESKKVIMVWKNAMVPPGGVSRQVMRIFLQMIDLDPSNVTCIHSTLDFVSRHAKI